MVLESVIANLLNRTLGMYVQNFEAKQLNVGLFSGDVKLRNLELRREALDQLHLPLNVVEGHLGQLTLSIPLTNLRGKPVKVHIEDVFLLAAPREDADYDPEEEEARAHKVKMDKLESAELLKERNTEGQSLEEQKKGQSFVQSLVTAIVDNVQISVKNIHIRYEDSISDPGHPFAAGITLAGFDAVSTDGEWKPTFIQSTSNLTHKLATLQSLAVYWDTDARLIGNGKGSQKGVDHDEFVKLLKGLIVSSDADGSEKANHQFILKPVSGRAGLEINKSGKSDRPKMKANLLFDELGFVLDDDQYRDALMLVDLFHYFIRHQEYKKLEPKARPLDDPRAWMKFAGQAVLDRIHDRNKKWSWAYFKERRDDRISYIELFKKKKKEETLTTDETSALDKLERKLSYEDLRFWRSLARNQLRKETTVAPKPQHKQTWGEWIWSGGRGQQPEHHEDDAAKQNAEARKELMEAINFDEKQQLAEDIDMPREYVKLQVELSLRTGSFTLKRDPHDQKTEILRLLFDTFKTQFLQRTDSMLVNLSLEGMRLYDGTTEGNLFPQIIKIKDAPEIADGDRITELGDNTEETSEKRKSVDASMFTAEMPEDPFFAVKFEKNPLDRSADTALTVKLKAMEIVYNPAFLVAIAKFFKPPETHMESIGALMETAGATVEQVRQQTRAGLEFALDEHKTINAQLDLQAPLIIIPDSVTRQSEICLIIDAGHISVSSELVDPETLKDVQSKQRQQLSEEDYERLESLMYDKFKLRLEQTQVLIGTTIEETKAQLEQGAKERNFHVIERIGMDFLVEICIVPKGSELTKFRITGSLPVLEASISDQKYKSLMKVIDFAIPRFSDPQTEQPTTPANEIQQEALKPTVSADLVSGRRPSAFQFSSMQHDLVMEEEGSVTSGTEYFSDAVEGSAEGEVSLKQRTFDFRFTVEKLQAGLYRSDPDNKKPDQLLVELVAETFYLNFYQQAFRMTADVSLQSLAVEDHVEENPLPEFKNLITSEENFSQEKQNLFNLQFIKVTKEHPEFISEFEGIATNLDVEVSTINLIVTRKTLLTLLDFVLITFTNQDQNAPEVDAKAASGDEATTDVVAATPAQPSPDKIRIRTDLKGIAVILNNDGIRLATLSLTTAKVAVFIAGKTMRVGGHLGNLSLIDDVNQGVPVTNQLRQLVTIQGDELAQFSYETYDEDSDVYPGYDTSIELKAGSLKVNFITEPFRKILDFLVKFGQMQAIFNAARRAAANQADQLQQRATKLHFDVLVKTPIVVFPRMVVTDQPERDALTANLGEIYANNKFLPLDDSGDAEVTNNINVGIRNIRLMSLLHYSDDQKEDLEMIDKVDIDFKVTSAPHKDGQKRPDTEIQGSMSDINLKITQEQLQFALELSKTIPAAFATTSEDEIEDQVEAELPDETVEPAKEIQRIESHESDTSEDSQTVVTSLQPELGNSNELWTKLDLIFKSGSIGLELIKSKDDEPVGDLTAASLSKFSLDETSIKLRMISDGSMESEFIIRSFTIRDSRAMGTNKFRKTMSLINTDVKQQFMASISMSGGTDRNLVVLLTLDSPRIILALDYLFAIRDWANTALQTAGPLEIEEESEPTDDAGSETTETTLADIQQDTETDSVDAAKEAQSGGMSMSFRINVVDAQIVLIANPALSNSEAIVLGTKQVLIAKQHAITVQVDKVGMFLCRMDQFEKNRMRILDDFSITTSLDMRSQSKESNLTNIEVDIEPLVLRLSLRDILLAMQIINRASAMSSETAPAPAPEPRRIAYGRSASSQNVKSNKPKSSVGQATSTVGRGPGAQTIATQAPSQMTLAERPKMGSAMLSREDMTVALAGIRVVLIGDKHELPMLDWSVKKFDVRVRDWSTNLTADTSIDTYFNIFNFSKSAWEPLVEPWTLGFHMTKEQNPAKLSVELYTRKTMELTLTSASIALASKSVDFLSSDDDILAKPRGMEAPYRIRNQTGFELYVWAIGDEDDEDPAAAKLEDGEETPWRFEDAITQRETLSPEGSSGIVGIRLEGSGFNSVERIHVTREGEALYNLYPKKDRVQHRLLVDIKLGADNIKNITFRSPFLVENNTHIPVEVGVLDPQQGNILKIEKIAPGDSRPAPVGAAYIHSLIIRPDQGFGYTWSNERLFWKDLLKRPMRTLTCRGENDDNAPPFYFRMCAAYDKKDPLTAIYPYMRVRLHAPVEVQNLLPYDFKYRINDHNTKQNWDNFLRKGGVSPVHTVDLSHLLMISIDLQDTPFKQSEFTVINSGDRETFSREKTLTVKDDKDLSLRLKLHYFNVPNSGGAFKVSIYAQYLILNRTGLPLDVKSKVFLGATKAAAGQLRAEGQDNDKPQPLMFSFATDDKKNRALLKLGDSQWSKPQSFDAIGSSYAVTLPSSSGRTEMMIGAHIAEGEGKYNLTRVVTITPRFVLKNKLGEEINIREPGSSDVLTLKEGDLLPLRSLRQGEGQQLSLCYPGINNQWTSPFNITNVGCMHVKIAKAKQRQQLVRVDILMEGATLFLHLSIETKHWPFSMRNESNTEFLFWQANPNVEDDDEDRISGWKPVRYRLPPRSVMPYAWDFPAAKRKEIILSANKREKAVKLAEIGNQLPMRIPPSPEQPRGAIIDLNVKADGPTQTLVLSNFKQSKSLYKQKSGPAGPANQSTASGFEVKEVDTDVTFSAQLRLAGIGVSLVNLQLRELLYFTLRDLELKYSDSPTYQTVKATIKWIQVDNQLYGGIFPILFYPSVVPKTGKEMDAHPILHASLTRVKDDSYGVLYIKYFTVLLQQMTLELDEDFIFALLDFIKVPGASWTETQEDRLCDDDLDIPEPQQEQSGQDIYFEVLHLQPMQFDISFVRTERINAEDTMTSSNPLMFAVNVFTMSVGNVNDAPIKYRALMLENARVSTSALVNAIRTHYVQESLRQIHVIIGSADFLGNPVGLFTNVASGITDIFYEPYQGLVLNERPQDLGVGIAKGASSFVKKSVFGFSDSMAKFTGSMSKGLAAATLDKEFQDQRRMTRNRNRPKHALYGFTAGGNAFASSLASGIGGLARHPLEGAEKEGVPGFLKGVGKGMLGLATKPAIGAFDFMSNTAEGVRNTTTVFDQDGLDRVRLTRFIGQDGIVRPYSQREALGQFWLKSLDSGKYFNEEYIAHMELPGKDLMVMVTYNSLVLARVKKLKSEWDVPLKDIQTISKERTGIAIVLKGGTNGPFVPVSDEQARNWLYKQIAIAVNAYNDKFSAKG